MDKIDLKSELKALYKPSAKEVVEIDVPAFNFLMVDGEGTLGKLRLPVPSGLRPPIAGYLKR